MSYLIALLAFSAVMIVLATLASVVVEAIHGLFNKRANDFKEMLTQLYKDAIVPIVAKQIASSEDAIKKEAEDLTEKADEFIASLVENPAIKKDSLINKLPFFKPNFEEFSTRQFVEQFSDTEIGIRLAKKYQDKADDVSAQVDAQIQSAIGRISYEFERYGEAARMYFHRRAAALSVIVSLFLAITLNVDAVRLYEALATDRGLSERVIDSISVETEKIEDQLLTISSENISDGNMEELKKSIQKIRTEASALETLKLPIGHDYYPYCAEWKEANLDLADLSGFKDVRCLALTQKMGYWTDNNNQQNQGLNKVNDINQSSENESFFDWLSNLVKGVIEVLTTETGYIWLFRVILTGALIGLGAPFWFKAYQFIAQFVPRRQPPLKDSSQERQPRSPSNIKAGPVIHVHNSTNSALKQPGANSSDEIVDLEKLTPAVAEPVKDPQFGLPVSEGLSYAELANILTSSGAKNVQ